MIEKLFFILSDFRTNFFTIYFVRKVDSPSGGKWLFDDIKHYKDINHKTWNTLQSILEGNVSAILPELDSDGLNTVFAK